jgi:ATP-dependent exoDNAse (exonuclease V) beta subunit
VLVDEFQDTDPLQIEILWQLCSEASKGSAEKPLTRASRPGALFLVGDPKQAIYRFRGADVNAYVAARKAIGNDALVEITTNFRSLRPILDFVNERFKSVRRIRFLYPQYLKQAELDDSDPVNQAAALKVAKLTVIVERLQNQSLKCKRHSRKLGSELVRHENMLRRAKLELVALKKERKETHQEFIRRISNETRARQAAARAAAQGS